MSDTLDYTPTHLNSTVEEIPEVEIPIKAQEPVTEIPKAFEPVVETPKAVLKTSTTEFSADKCYTFTSAVQVHTEPDISALVVGVRNVTDFVKPERVLDLNGYIWAEYHTSPKHIRYVALAASDGSEKFVE